MEHGPIAHVGLDLLRSDQASFPPIIASHGSSHLTKVAVHWADWCNDDHFDYSSNWEKLSNAAAHDHHHHVLVGCFLRQTVPQHLQLGFASSSRFSARVSEFIVQLLTTKSFWVILLMESVVPFHSFSACASVDSEVSDAIISLRTESGMWS
ncbi:hypothetical protein SAY87_015292 [Trapa incisa]|uniref:Uncharacterized protein n=1 Tax=Trapa incisa TaxID=236973 RepID=A0AAN7GLF9_9MYRT|nr:hypothetical protein SAY87_015292 [Trapa incisa]